MLGVTTIPGDTIWDDDTYELITGNAPALDIALVYAPSRYAISRLAFDLADKYWQLDANIGFKVPVDIKAVTLSFYATFGAGLGMYVDDDGLPLPRFVMPLQGGLMVNTTWVPGLYVLVGYQYNLSLFELVSATTKPADSHMFKVNLGYAFKL
jgi:hypothetical protein